MLHIFACASSIGAIMLASTPVGSPPEVQAETLVRLPLTSPASGLELDDRLIASPSSGDTLLFEAKRQGAANSHELFRREGDGTLTPLVSAGATVPGRPGVVWDAWPTAVFGRFFVTPDGSGAGVGSIRPVGGLPADESAALVYVSAGDDVTVALVLGDPAPGLPDGWTFDAFGAAMIGAPGTTAFDAVGVSPDGSSTVAGIWRWTAPDAVEPLLIGGQQDPSSAATFGAPTLYNASIAPDGTLLFRPGQGGQGVTSAFYRLHEGVVDPCVEVGDTTPEGDVVTQLTSPPELSPAGDVLRVVELNDDAQAIVRKDTAGGLHTLFKYGDEVLVGGVAEHPRFAFGPLVANAAGDVLFFARPETPGTFAAELFLWSADGVRRVVGPDDITSFRIGIGAEIVLAINDAQQALIGHADFGLFAWTPDDGLFPVAARGDTLRLDGTDYPVDDARLFPLVGSPTAPETQRSEGLGPSGQVVFQLGRGNDAFVAKTTIADARRVDFARNCPADWNTDGFLNDLDFFDFINDFFAGSGPRGGSDFNDDGFENEQDFFDFVNAFFTPSGGCV